MIMNQILNSLKGYVQKSSTLHHVMVLAARLSIIDMPPMAHGRMDSMMENLSKSIIIHFVSHKYITTSTT